MSGDISTLFLSEQLILLLAALVLMASFLLLMQPRLVAVINAFAWQGILVAMVTALVAFSEYEPHLYLSAALTLVLKGLMIPWLLHRQVKKLGLTRFVGMRQPVPVLMLAASLVIFSYYIVLPIGQLENSGATRNVIAITLAVVLIGLLTMSARTHAIAQVAGFMSMENGLFFAAVATTKGMPLVIELGVAFDVLVASVLFGVFFLEIHGQVGSLDVNRMNKLSEKDDNP